MRALLASLLLCLPLITISADNFYYSPKARTAYRLIMDLRLDEARSQILEIRRAEPQNLVVLHLEDYIDFFQLYITEEQTLFDSLKDARSERLKTLERTCDDSPYCLYAQADIRLHWSLLRLKFGEYLAAFIEVSKAYKLLKENEALYPEFMPNKKNLGVLHAMVGTIPDGYRWGIKLLSGLDGTIQQGRRELEAVLAQTDERDFLFSQEARVLYAYLLLHLEDEPEAAWAAVNSAGLHPERSPLHGFVLANVAMRTERNDKAIAILEACPEESTFFSFPYLHYMTGVALLRKLDPRAKKYFEEYLREYKGHHFVKDAYQKLAWNELIHGRPDAYRRYMQKVKERGTLVTGGDKSAMREAESPGRPHPGLLKARLLFDGGYYERAYQLLRSFPASELLDAGIQLQYNYRMGRLMHVMGQSERALVYYRKTIQTGQDLPDYYACNSALQAGLIYEKQGKKKLARQYYERCLSIKPDEYRTGLHQRAKSGLNRLEEE